MSTESRRRFVQGTAAIAAASLVGTRVTRALAQGSRKKIGFALCGLGGLSKNQIAPAFQRTKHCRLAGIVTDTAAKAQKWKAQYGIPDRSIYTYDTMAKMADNPDIDVVYIVTPNALHAEQTALAARAGKHVFCEKPMEVSVAKAQQMIDVCEAAKRKLGVAYRCQYDPNHLECIRIARAKEFGDVRIIEASFGFPIGDAGQWRLKRALSGGGALMDVGIYALQATRYLTGEEPIAVSAMEAKTDAAKFAEVDESILWQARFPSAAGPGLVRSGNGRFRPLHPRRSAEQGRRRRMPARRQDHDGHLRIRAHGSHGTSGLNRTGASGKPPASSAPAPTAPSPHAAAAWLPCRPARSSRHRERASPCTHESNPHPPASALS